ncbi:MAG: transcription antitermination factor NusB [Epsilonproteobacteria bacterium]|nr:transcription antitermination factor NusB [Campylobacterota bacterium]
MATRHQVRETVVSLLYAYDIGNEEIGKFEDTVLEEKKIRNKQKEFALELLNGVLENLEEIDSEIDKHLKEWNIKEIGHVERAILRLGTYELMDKKNDDAVVINEAIELSKTLCSDNVPKFVNGVLGSIQKDLKSKRSR